MTDHDESERLNELVSSTARLPRSVEPPADQWPEIRRRIDQSRVISIQGEAYASPGLRPHRARWMQASPRWYVLAATAALLLVGVVYVLRRPPIEHTAPAFTEEPAAQTTAPEVPPSVPSVQPERAKLPLAQALPVTSREDADRDRVLRAFNAYEDAARELSWSLESRRRQLDPKTLAVLDTCLKVIDKAIGEARAALARNPGSAVLNGFLQSSYEQKLDLLKRTVEGPRRTL
jgi:hypothetical protein